MSPGRLALHRSSDCREQKIRRRRRMCCDGRRRMLAGERRRFRPSAAVRNPCQAPRYSFRADLEIEWGSAMLRGSTRDISASGMFIEAADPLWVGAGFTARLTLDRPVKLDCFVKRIEPGKGMGVSVAVSESESQKIFHDLLSSLSTPGT
ncbi:MAG: hypothetical protein DMG46_20615 [Acidobacteria bacterium]|nr:MAG: hypothetical protein DMG46_20615 [Acidobacteriota bacterium]